MRVLAGDSYHSTSTIVLAAMDEQILVHRHGLAIDKARCAIHAMPATVKPLI